MYVLYAAVAVLTAAVCWINVMYKLVEIARFRRRAPATVGLVVALAAMATALTVQPPPVNQALDRLVGREASGQVLGQIMVVISMTGFQAMLLYITGPRALAPRRVRLRIAVVAPIVLTLIALFVIAPGHQPPVLHEFLTARRWGAVYLTLYTTTMLFASVDSFRMVRDLGRITDKDIVRIGLRMIAAGTIVGGVYSALKLVLTLIRTYAMTWLTGIEKALIVPLIMVGPLLLVIGATLPSWGSRIGLERPLLWWGYFRSYRKLRGLWLLVVLSANPDTLEPITTSWWRDWLVVHPRQQLYRRWLEINDALLLLRRYEDPDVASEARALATAAGRHGLLLDATVAAARIVVAVDAMLGGPERPPAGSVVLEPLASASDMRGEVALLRVVVDELNSTIVARIRADAARRRAAADLARVPGGGTVGQP